MDAATAEAAATTLTRSGRSGKRGPNNPWLVAAWFGVLKAGGVVVPTMPLLRARELTTIGEVGQFSIAICDARFLDELAEADLPGLTIIPYGGDGTT